MSGGNFKEKRLIFLLLIGIILLFAVSKFIWTKEIKRNGIYTKGVVVKSDATKGGILITVKYEYLNNLYESVVGSDLGKGSIGCQYFIQFKPGAPDEIVFHKDKPVPACLTNVAAPKEGWKEIPGCP